MSQRVLFVAAALLLATGCGSTSGSESQGGDSTASEYFQPEVRDEGDQGPFWMTSFGLAIPDGHWELKTVDTSEYCQPVNESLFQLTTDQGVQVAAFGGDPVLDFSRASSRVDGDMCIVEVVTMGDYIDDLGNSYMVSNKTMAATFTPEEFFSGQQAGPDTIKPLEPVLSVPSGWGALPWSDPVAAT